MNIYFAVLKSKSWKWIWLKFGVRFEFDPSMNELSFDHYMDQDPDSRSQSISISDVQSFTEFGVFVGFSSKNNA